MTATMPADGSDDSRVVPVAGTVRARHERLGRAATVLRVAAPTAAGSDECRLVPTAGEVIAPDDERLAELSKALGHPARVRIVRLLQDGQACITGDLVDQLGLAQSTVSEHLRILRDAGLIHGEIEGPRTRYCIDATGLATLHAGIAAI